MSSDEMGNLVEAIQSLHGESMSAADIARRFSLDQATVLHAIHHGRFPSRQSSLTWTLKWKGTFSEMMHIEAIIESLP